MTRPDTPQVASLRAYVEGREHADHDTFAMGREFAAALLATIDADLEMLAAIVASAYGETTRPGGRTTTEVSAETIDRASAALGFVKRYGV